MDNRVIFFYGINENNLSLSPHKNEIEILLQQISISLNNRGLSTTFLWHDFNNKDKNRLSIYLSDIVIFYTDKIEKINIDYEIAMALAAEKLLIDITNIIIPLDNKNYINLINTLELFCNSKKRLAIPPNTDSLVNEIFSLIPKKILSSSLLINFLNKNKKIFHDLIETNPELINRLPFPSDQGMTNPILSLNSSFDFSCVEDSFPIEIYGLECKSKLSMEEISKLRYLLETHKLLIIKNQNLTPYEQIEFTKYFGKPDRAWDNRNRDEEFQEIQIISNNYRGGSYHYSQKKISSIRFWHTDTSFLSDPTRYTFLHIKTLPPEGGDTKFINTELAYRSLPESIKSQIDDAKACHSFNYFFGKLLKKRGLQREEFIEDVFHPLVRKGETGNSVYLSRLAISHIDGMDENESDKILTQLYEHCKKSVFRYRHTWQNGDILVWDNFATLHKGTYTDPIYTRALNRTTVKESDIHPFSM